jgi:hypothetical protein
MIAQLALDFCSIKYRVKDKLQRDLKGVPMDTITVDFGRSRAESMGVLHRKAVYSSCRSYGHTLPDGLFLGNRTSYGLVARVAWREEAATNLPQKLEWAALSQCRKY